MTPKSEGEGGRVATVLDWPPLSGADFDTGLIIWGCTMCYSGPVISTAHNHIDRPSKPI